VNFHHVGYACRDLDAELSGLAALAYAEVGERFTDPVQGVNGLFCEGGGPRLELLAPLPGSDVLDPWLRGPAKLYHLAYEVQDIDVALERVTRDGARVVRPSVPAVAFDGRPIAFLMLRNRLLVEYIGSAR
jgi:methylmalonyl-CoA/ethylmalonyl-CoA epimerase